jgi:hypothetical protein
MPILENFDGDEDLSSFIFCKIESLIVENSIELSESVETNGNYLKLNS